jgi:hypothetical protein|tara:strand:+ start:1756 stop:2520 length:765 start_codon:yes stop_codon:yes gene_type:complete
MSNYKILSKEAHKDLRVNTERSAAYGDNIMYTMTFPMEFRDIQSCYPIFFCKDPESGQLYPAALLGLEQDQNLFLSDSGWDASYIPMMIRRHPFLIGFQADPDGAEGATKPVVSIDSDSPRLIDSSEKQSSEKEGSSEKGEALFNQDGTASDFLQSSIGTLESIHRGLEHNKGFIAALLEHQLLESFTLQITLNDGSNNELAGFYTIAEQKLQSLDGETLAKFNAQGYLQSIYMAIASFARLRPMIDKKNAQLA